MGVRLPERLENQKASEQKHGTQDHCIEYNWKETLAPRFGRWKSGGLR